MSCPPTDTVPISTVPKSPKQETDPPNAQRELNIYDPAVPAPSDPQTPAGAASLSPPRPPSGLAGPDVPGVGFSA